MARAHWADRQWVRQAQSKLSGTLIHAKETTVRRVGLFSGGAERLRMVAVRIVSTTRNFTVVKTTAKSTFRKPIAVGPTRRATRMFKKKVCGFIRYGKIERRTKNLTANCTAMLKTTPRAASDGNKFCRGINPPVHSFSHAKGWSPPKCTLWIMMKKGSLLFIELSLFIDHK